VDCEFTPIYDDCGRRRAFEALCEIAASVLQIELQSAASSQELTTTADRKQVEN
jgi:hypothetical protein